eukprot:4032920-Amphidinium_carterae.2
MEATLRANAAEIRTAIVEVTPAAVQLQSLCYQPVLRSEEKKTVDTPVLSLKLGRLEKSKGWGARPSGSCCCG